MTDSSNEELTTRLALALGNLFPAPGGGPLRLVALMGDEPGRRHTLHSESVVLGRGDDCDLQIDDTKVSRRHARLTLVEGQWTIEDLGSRNGTMVNGEILREPAALAVGDRIQLSTETLLIFARQDPLEDILLHRQQMEVIGQLAAGIAHDFNNLLNVISVSMAHLSALDPATALGMADVRDCHTDITAAARHAAELTARLMKIARRTDKHEQAASYGAVDLSALCDDVLQLVRRTFEASIEIDASVQSGLSVDGERGALHQLLMNLCINARDAMPEGGKLTLAGYTAGPRPVPGTPRQPGSQLVIEVRDTGIGMDDKTRARVFEPFFTTKAMGAGSGLGLATVYEVATNHGGLVEVESEPGKGSTFRVRLPIGQRARERDPSQRRQHAQTQDSGDRPATGRVLVVDDQELVRRSLGRLLRAAGHEVTFAADGREALEAYANADPRPDIVLMDLDMPNLSGSDTLQRMRELDPHARVLLISGYYDETRKRRLLQMGALDFLSKPVDAELLRASIRLALATSMKGA